MFGNIMNEETHHWNPMSSNPIIPPNSVQDHIDLKNEGEEDAEGNGVKDRYGEPERGGSEWEPIKKFFSKEMETPTR
jgi:hypothetical protein